MIITVDVPSYKKTKGIEYNWEEGFEIETYIVNGVIKIIANKQGLLSLANHFLNLSQDEIPVGHDMHFDDSNSLENKSAELIIIKK
jgi:hypothetical protein